MKKTILIDFNNLAFRYFFIKEVAVYTPQPDFAIWRYMILEVIQKWLYLEKGINEVVIAVDDKNPWRKSYFSRYKESRKKKRDKQEVDWQALYGAIDSLAGDLKHYMPYKVLKVRGAEADDIIAILALESRGESIVISNDEDYLQLCSSAIRIWNPQKKKYTDCEDTEDFVIRKSLTGQSKDDIFNVKTPNNWGQTDATRGKRKPGFGPKSCDKVMKEGYEKWLEKEDLEENFKRNRVLMDFNYIPHTMCDRIMTAYKRATFPPPQNIYKFFKHYNMRGFLDDFTNIERKLMELY